MVPFFQWYISEKSLAIYLKRINGEYHITFGLNRLLRMDTGQIPKSGRRVGYHDRILGLRPQTLGPLPQNYACPKFGKMTLAHSQNSKYTRPVFPRDPKTGNF